MEWLVPAAKAKVLEPPPGIVPFMTPSTKMGVARLDENPDAYTVYV